MPLPDPLPAQWNWVDLFTRTFLGPDYTLTLPPGQSATIQSGELSLGAFPAFHPEWNTLRSSARLNPGLWTGGNVSVQYDARLTLSAQSGITPSFGAAVIGTTKTLSWDGQRLWWGVTVLAEPGVVHQAGTTERTRLTVDTTAGRIQLQRGDDGLADVALPGDYLSDMAGAGYVELWQRPSSGSSNVFSTAQVYFDAFAVRAGDGTSSGGTGQIGGGAPTLGGVWRFSGGGPDDAIGTDGDVWNNTATGELYQREAGVYVLRTTLLGPAGPAGPVGPTGAQGEPGPAGPAADGALVPTPLILLSPTAPTGDLIHISSGGLLGWTLTGQNGPAVDVAFLGDGSNTYEAVVYPYLLGAGYLRLIRTEPLPYASIIMATAPLLPPPDTGGSGGSGS